MRRNTAIHHLQIVLAMLATQTLGCSFILDFDKLQSGAADPDSGTGPGNQPPNGTDGAPSPIPGGDAGTGDCAKPCKDDDPCTTDFCRAGECMNVAKKCTASSKCASAACVDGKCEETPIVGLVLDGYDETILADEILRSELVGSGDRFYRATFGTFEGKRDVSLATFDTKRATDLREIRFSAILGGADVEMGSPASLVPDQRLGKNLNAYVAVRSPNKQAGDLLKLSFDVDLAPEPGNPVIAAPSNYRFASERMGPSGGALVTGEPFVVWAGSNASQSGVYLQRGDEVADTGTPTFVGTTGISGISALRVNAVPGAVWMTNRMEGVFIEAALANGLGAPVPLFQCHQEPGFGGYSLDVSQSLGDIWTVTWTKRSGADYVTEVSAMVCLETGCTDLTTMPPGQTCSAAQVAARVFPNVRGILTRTLKRAGDPANVLYQAVLAAEQDPNTDEGGLNLLLTRIEFDLLNDAEQKKTLIAGLALDTTSLADTPSWPSIVLLPPDKLAVSWVKPQAGGQGDELHVQRHHICFEE